MLTVSLLFVIGFSAVFVLLGAGAAVFRRPAGRLPAELNRLAGLVMISMGSSFSGLIRAPSLYQERRLL